jgi:thiosulfate/3-mercaptopyruvate sulfurtransferase
MAAWERVWIDADMYSQDLHSLINCTECHGGQAVDDMTLAHTDMYDRPIQDMETCGACHTDVTPASLNSLHSTLAGYDTAIYSRSVPENHPVLEEMESNHCNSCHATCGDCHVSQPVSVGGGLLDGHTYIETPPMSQTCTACHGSRVKNEYFGLNEGYPSDVHFRARMGCSDCHTADEIHGVNITADHRYDGAQEPNCESCHVDQVGVGSGIEQHEIHGTEILSCQSCHSVEYTNCTNCHVEQTDDGVPFYSIESHDMGFYLAHNELQNAERPYRYVTVRHIPVDIDSFSFYGDNLLSNFDNRSTWEYATPHNIQRNTPQTESCESCHGNDAIFLTADKVVPEELNANANVIVDHAPPLPDGYVPATPLETEVPADTSTDFWGNDTAPTEAPADFWGGDATPTEAPTDFWGDPVPESTPEATPPADFWGG